MDRRTFINGTLAAGIMAVTPFGASLQAHDRVLIADGDGWGKVESGAEVHQNILALCRAEPDEAIRRALLKR